jgi:hypothetical protein
MKKVIMSLAIILFSALAVSAQGKFTLSGNVKDLSDGEDLIGLTVSEKKCQELVQ